MASLHATPQYSTELSCYGSGVHKTRSMLWCAERQRLNSMGYLGMISVPIPNLPPQAAAQSEVGSNALIRTSFEHVFNPLCFVLCRRTLVYNPLQ